MFEATYWQHFHRAQNECVRSSFGIEGFVMGESVEKPTGSKVKFETTTVILSFRGIDVQHYVVHVGMEVRDDNMVWTCRVTDVVDATLLHTEDDEWQFYQHSIIGISLEMVDMCLPKGPRVLNIEEDFFQTLCNLARSLGCIVMNKQYHVSVGETILTCEVIPMSDRERRYFMVLRTTTNANNKEYLFAFFEPSRTLNAIFHDRHNHLGYMVYSCTTLLSDYFQPAMVE